MILRNGLIVLVLICFSLLHGAGCVKRSYGAPLVSQNEVEHFVAKEEMFSVDIPEEWDKKESGFPYELQDENMSAIELSGPISNDRAIVKISLLYYKNGSFFEDYRHYIHVQQNTPTRIDIDKKSVFSKMKVDHKKALSFEIKTTELVFLYPVEQAPMEEGMYYKFAPPYKQVTMIEKFIIIPAKRGFFVIHYDTPKDMFDDCDGVFMKIVKSLHFINPVPWQEKGK